MMVKRRIRTTSWAAALVIIALTLWSWPASAEPREKAVGLGLVLVAPSFGPKSNTSPLALGWGLQAFVKYGPDVGAWSWDFVVGLSMTWASFGAKKHDFVYNSGKAINQGDLSFDGAYYHPELFIQYKVISGYRFAPTIEASAGLMWATFKNGTLTGVEGEQVDVRVPDFGQGGATVSFAFLLDYRLADYVHVGSAIKYTRSFFELLSDTITAGLIVSYRWW